MKKITILIALMIYSLGFAQSIEGTWKLSATDGLWVGSAQKGTVDAITYWPPDATVLPGQRPCQWDDEFVFNADGTFQNVLQTQTWLETWQAASEGCGAPVAPHDGSNPATYVYSSSNGTLVLNGLGAFMGLPKATNTGEINSPANAASTITYIATLTETTLKLDIQMGTAAGAAWWSFEFTKKLAGQPIIGGINLPFNPTIETGVFDLADYVVAPATTNPSSDSPGVFSYTSSNPAVATISGSNVFITGAGETTITAIQAASPPFLSGEVTAKLFVSLLDPLTGPTDPIARNAWDVKSIFNGIDSPVAPQYSNVPGVTFQDFGGTTIVGDVTLGDGNIVKKYVKHLYSGIQVGAVSLDVSAMTMLHMDVYSPDFTTFKIKLEDVTGGATAQEIEVPFTKVQGSWNSYDIDLSTYTTPDLSKLKFIVPVSFEGSGTQLYIDNVYFYRPATSLGVSSFEKSNVKMYPNPVKNTLTIDANSAINRVSVYNVLGQEVMKASPKSNSVTLQTSELQRGVYMVTTEIDGKISTSKVVKE